MIYSHREVICYTVTYLVRTDGRPASEAISQHLERQVDGDDHLEVVNVMTEDDLDEREKGEDALEVFEERLGGRASVTTRQVRRGRSPTEELLTFADDVDADQLVTALRRHSWTERIIFGSVSHKLLQRTTRPITLVPLKEYQSPTE